MTTLTYHQSQYTIIALISLVITLIGLYLIFSVYRRTKSHPLIYLIVIHVLLLPYYVFHTLLHIIGQYEVGLTKFLFRLTLLLITTICLILVLFIESLRSEKPSTILIMLVTWGTGVSVLVSILPDTVLWDSEIGPYIDDFSRGVYAIELLILTSIVFYQISKFFPSTPKSFKKTAYLFFTGCIFPIIGPAILIALKTSLIIWGIEILALAIGVAIITLSILIDDRVLRILPFNVYRLSVMNMEIGLSIFDVLFETKKQGPDMHTLIPHLMTANIQFVQSVIAKTERIQYIKTDNYIFIFESLQNAVTFIIADQASLLLRSALKEFTKDFVNEFGSNLDSIRISEYAKAEVFIEQYFSFLPSHKLVSISS